MIMLMTQETSQSLCRKLSALLLLVALGYVWSVPALAVDAGKISYTAELMCAYRAIGARDPDPKTRNPDSLAQHFVDPELVKRMPYLGQKFDAAKIAIDMQDTGVFYYVNARTLHMDNLLRTALREGAQQVVILGAGFDSRAYRFHKEFPKVHFFEIDLPTTSQDKQKRVHKLLGALPDWVSYVPIDFNTQTLSDVLGRAGFATDRMTFYVWEGVTYYIQEAAVDATLRFIAANSAPGSQIVFDYMLKDVVQGLDYSPYGARPVVFFVANHGEPYVFGIAPAQLKNFVNRRGLALVSDLGPAELTRRYLIDSDGAPRGKISGFLRIALAQVPAPNKRLRLRETAEKTPPKQSPGLEALAHRVSVPADVQRLLDSQAACYLSKDFDGLMRNFSEHYQNGGYTKADAAGYLRQLFQQRNFRRYQIVLTHFKQNGDRALIDGFIQREGFRIPLLVQDIIRESDGRWRWYGNQR
jgi:methyltransferase (TIGR00027 family)